jgi:hypothetical protein
LEERYINPKVPYEPADLLVENEPPQDS